MTGPLYRVGWFCTRHHWAVIAVWVLVAVALAAGSRAVGEQNSDNLTLPGTGSTKAQDLLKAKLPKQAYGTNPVVLEAAKGKLTDSANKKAVDDTVKSLKKEPGVIRAVSPLSKEGAAALSQDKKIGYISLASYVPLLMFAILFGLSMDYEVFLLTQIQEHYKKDGDPHEAVVKGLASTGRVITSAALIMVFVFSSFLLNGNAIVKQFGLGLAAAIAIDATIVRCLAVPAVMALFGKPAWWLPRWLDRALPRISIEGDDYFAERDAAARAHAPEPEPVAR
jgi:uncharacterized membrane protein YdfJ with MMPL/SSD domain